MNTLLRCLTLLMVSTAISRAGLNEALVKNAKQATALVLSQRNGYPIGTAFCIDSKGYFITSHTVAEQHVAGKLTLVLDPGGKNERRLSAKVVRTDEEPDLALLRCEAPIGRVLRLRDGDTLLPGTTLTAFGYPSPSKAHKDPVVLPDISVSFGQVREWVAGSNRVIQIGLSESPTKGHSGGPILNDEGLVVGVIVSSNRRPGPVSEAVLGRVWAFLNDPVLRADFPQTIPWSDRHKPMRLTAAVDVFLADAPRVETTLTIIDGYGERNVKAEETPSGFIFDGPLVPERDPSRVRLRLTMSQTELSCLAEDRSFRGAGGNHLLSELEAYQKGQGLLTLDGKTLPIDATDETLTVYPGGEPLEIPFSKIEAFQIEPIVEPPFVGYRLDTHTVDGMIASIEGEIRFIDMPDLEIAIPRGGGRPNADTPSRALQAHQPFAKQIEQLPAPVTDVISAGGGRYLLLRMEELEQLAIFDVVALKVIKTFALPDPKALVAGGASAFVIALPEQSVIQRISLETLEREQIAMLPPSGAVANIAMGYNADGPLLVRNAQDYYLISFFDLQTLKPIPLLSNVRTTMGTPYESMTYRFSADGRTLSIQSHFNIEVLRLSGTKATTKSLRDLVYLVPGPNGAYLYTNRGIYTPDLVRTGPASDLIRIPTTFPLFYLEAESLPTPYSALSQVRLILNMTTGMRPLVRLPETPELTMTKSGVTKGMPFDKRIHYIPQARVLITIPTKGQCVVVRYVDIEKCLKDVGLGYLFIDSLPVVHVEQGGHYQYQVSAKSNNPRVGFTLDTGPAGMQLSEGGLLSWNVPGDFTGQTRVVVNLRNGDGRALRHDFTIEVLP